MLVGAGILLSLHFSLFTLAEAQTDTVAARIIDRYLAILNIDALPQDSMLVLTTTITKQGGGDTVVMTRLFQKPQMFRVDVRDSHGLQTGLCSNGKDRFRAYPYQGDWWGDIKPEDFYNRLTGFDFRGPLYNWRMNGLELTYLGKVDVDHKGAKLDAVRVVTSTTYPRTYFFEESGLLCLIIEDEVMSDGIPVLKDTHINWKCEHEYGRVGETVLPTLESFLRHGEQTVLSTEMHFEKRDNLRFNQD